MRSGQWEAARDLLTAGTPADASERLALAMAEAEVAVDQDFAQGTDTAPAKLDVLAGLVETTEAQWDLEMLRLRYAYLSALFRPAQPETTRAAATAGADVPAGADLLAERAAGLRETAPDDRRAGSVAFYSGLIEDNLRSDSPKAFPFFSEALTLADKCGDGLLAALALRHLGDHAHTAGDLQLARAQWERSTELRQTAGHVLGVLAQQMLLAQLMRDEGDPGAARGLALEVRRWAGSLEIGWIAGEADSLLASVPPH